MQWFDTPGISGVPDYSQMGALGKIGLVLQNIADPGTLPRYQQSLQRQEEINYIKSERQKQAQKESALAALAPQLGTMAPQAAYSALASIDPSYADDLINYNVQQNDPVRKTQLASANLALQNARNEAAQTENLRRIFTQPGSVVSEAGPTRPQQPSPLAMLQQAAAIAPEKYGTTYLSQLSQPAQIQTEGLPTGYVWQDGKAVKIPGLPTQFELPEGIKVPEGMVPVPDPAAVGGFKLERMTGLDHVKTDYKEHQLKAASFAERMEKSSGMLAEVEAKSPDASRAKLGHAGNVEAGLAAIPSFGMTDKLGAGIVKLNATPEQQQYLNAAQEWIRAKLRKESGAVIGEQEMKDEFATYFPAPGDKPDVQRQKAKLRAIATEAMKKESGGAYEGLFQQDGDGWGIQKK